MGSVNISLKDGASSEELESAKKHVTDNGGKIVNEFSLINAFTAEVPDDKVQTLKTNENLIVEKDGQVHTQ